MQPSPRIAGDDRHPAPWTGDPHEFGDDGSRVVHVAEDAGAPHSVKTGVLEREGAHVAIPEFDGGAAPCEVAERPGGPLEGTAIVVQADDESPCAPRLAVLPQQWQAGPGFDHRVSRRQLSYGAIDAVAEAVEGARTA
jgi:hypothetical protein